MVRKWLLFCCITKMSEAGIWILKEISHVYGKLQPNFLRSVEVATNVSTNEYKHILLKICYKLKKTEDTYFLFLQIDFFSKHLMNWNTSIKTLKCWQVLLWCISNKFIQNWESPGSYDHTVPPSTNCSYKKNWRMKGIAIILHFDILLQVNINIKCFFLLKTIVRSAIYSRRKLPFMP